MQTKLCMLMASGLLWWASCAFPHHAWDPTQGIAVEWHARIEQVSWDGAHVMYRVRLPDLQQGADLWQTLGASPRILRQRGIQKSTLAVGAEVTVIGYLDALSKIVALRYLVAADGHRYEMGFYPPPVPPRASRPNSVPR